MVIWKISDPHSVAPLPNGDLLVSDCENNQCLLFLIRMAILHGDGSRVKLIGQYHPVWGSHLLL